MSPLPFFLQALQSVGGLGERGGREAPLPRYAGNGIGGLFHDVFTKAHEDGRNLGPCCPSLGRNCGSTGAADKARGVGPPDGLPCIAADRPSVGETRQVGLCAHVITLESGIAIQNGRHLLSGNGVVRAEVPVAITIHNPVFRRPGNSTLPDCGLHMGWVLARTQARK